MTDDRDQALDAELRRLTPPPHRPGFSDEVWALVDARSAAPPVRGARVRRRVLALAAVAAVAAAMAIAFVLTGVPGVRRSASAPATAREVAARMAGSLRSLHSLRGAFESDWGEGRTTGTFAVDAAGDSRSHNVTTHKDTVGGRYRGTTIYNAAEHVLLDYGWDKTTAGVELTGQLRTLTATELADRGGVPFSSMAALVRAALAEDDPDIRITETVFRGRAAWRADFTKRAFRDSLRGVEVVVDKATGILLQYRHRDEPHREPAWTYTVTRLEVDPPLRSDQFATTAPRGAHVVDLTTDAYCSLSQAEARAGYVPVVAGATSVPFKLAEVANFPQGPTSLQFFSASSPSLPGPNPATEVMLHYRLGLDSYTILQAPVAERDRKTLAREDRRLARAPTYRSEVLRRGAFAGERAQTWFSTLGAFLEVHSVTRCVRIGGDLTRRELLAVAASLRPAHE